MRRLCDACKRPYTAGTSTCEYLGLPTGSVIYEAVGCDACSGKGLRGRVGIYEVLKVNPELRSIVATRSPTQEIHACALKHGMIELKQYAGILLLEGTTSVEEILPVVSAPE